MKPDLLLMQAFLGSTEKSLAEMCDVHRLFASSDRDAFFDSVAHRIRAVATGGMLGLSRELMDRMPALEIIAVNGIGRRRRSRRGAQAGRAGNDDARCPDR